MSRFVCAILIAGFSWLPAAMGQQADSPPSEGLSESAQIVYLPLERGRVDCGKLFDAVSDELHWVAGSITAFSRTFGVETDGHQYISQERVEGLVQQFPTVFSYADSPETNRPSLAVNVDELANVLGDQKSELRQWLSKLQKKPLAKLSKVDATWKSIDRSPPRIVVVMAGLHGVESTADQVALELHQRSNLPMCVFRYPNDAPIGESAGLLVVQLQDFQLQYPKSKITLVTHSMGGLVSRAAIEMEGASGNERSTVTARTGIDQLVQIFPPNAGSALAEYGPILEGAEQVYRIANRGREKGSRRLFSAIVDGFNEATSDLKPNSRFLTSLNQQSRNPNVRYSIIAGNDGPLRPAMTLLISGIWERVADSVDEPEEIDRRVRDVLTCAELQRGRGDGVVALESARLPGVDDFTILKMHHLIWNEPESKEGKQLLDEVASRLGIAL